MNDDVLGKYLRKPSAASPAESPASDPEGTENLGCFGFLRGVRDRAVMLELRKKDGTVLAIAYSYIERIVYQPDGQEQGITLHGAGQKIRIRGRNLGPESVESVRLLGALARHRVPWVQESDRTASAAAADSATSVESIDW